MSATTATLPAIHSSIDQEVPIHHTTPSTGRGGGGYYKSFLKPGKFWQRNTNKVSSSEQDGIDQEQQKQQKIQEDNNDITQQRTKKSFISMPTPFKSTKSDLHQSPALQEAAKAEVYKLSTVNDSGVFLPPSPKLDSKRDHWVELDEEAMIFRLPSPECLTSYGKDNNNPTFYTPSATVFPRSSSVDTTNEDDVPSLITDLSSGQ